jgi:hypothetical protein
VNPFHDLRKNRLSGAHFASLAPHLLAENAKLIPIAHITKMQNLLYSQSLLPIATPLNRMTVIIN